MTGSGSGVKEAAEVAATIAAYTPRSVPPAAAVFARAVTALAAPGSVARAKALLFACSRAGAFALSVGLECRPEVVLHPSVIERFVAHAAASGMSPPTLRTLRTNLRHVAAQLGPAPTPACLPRERAKTPYSHSEIAAYLALADTQPTVSRRMRAAGLICLGAGAGLMGADLRSVTGADVKTRSGGMVVEVQGRRARTVPVLARYQPRLEAAAEFFEKRYIIGGARPERRNVTGPLTSSLAGGADLPRLDTGRLRSTWLAAIAEAIGLRAFMDAAGIACTQRLGDLVAGLAAPDETTAVALLGAVR